MTTHSCILARKSHGQRSLVGYSPWGCEESGLTERLTHRITDLVTTVFPEMVPSGTTLPNGKE